MLVKSNNTCEDFPALTSGAFIVGFFARGFIFASIPPGPSKYSICFRASDIGFGKTESSISSNKPALTRLSRDATRREDVAVAGRLFGDDDVVGLDAKKEEESACCDITSDVSHIF